MSAQLSATELIVYCGLGARAREGGLILHTSVTIGYDAPWRTIHPYFRASSRFDSMSVWHGTHTHKAFDARFVSSALEPPMPRGRRW